MACPQCQAAVPEGARFCPSCGAALVARPDERRLVTVLIADLVGFTSFAERTDPERVKDVVDRCFARLVPEIRAFGGELDKIVGDEIVAHFGAHQAHEDDAERAVRAALRMQEVLADEAGAIGVDVQMRVGVNTGEVLVGALRAGGDPTVMGDVVNTASRLETAAQPGEVLVGPDTWIATREHIRYRAVGALAVKGREEPVEAYVAIEATAPPGRRTPRATRLVGRDAELTMAEQALRTAFTRRRAQLVLLVGEAGVGKSRLARELVHRTHHDHAAAVLVGACAPYGETNPLAPVAEALRHATGVALQDPLPAAHRITSTAVDHALGPHAEPATIVRITEGLLHLMGRGATEAVDPTRARDQALRAAAEYLEARCRERPLVVVFADLHWAAPEVLELVDRMLARLRSQPFVLVATARPELEDRWSPAPGRHNSLVLHVDPLDGSATRALIEELVGPGAPRALVDALAERSGGNPFFAEELAALVRESVGDGEAPPADPERALQRLPATLRGLVAARLDGLSPTARSVLSDCAVAGPAGAIALVAALAPDPDAVAAAVDDLVSRELLEIEGDEYRFSSEVIREVAYSTLTKAERARRHAACAAWHEEQWQHAPVGEHGDQRAHHYRTAAELARDLGRVDGVPPDLAARAVAALGDAAARARTIEAWPLVARLAEQALELVDAVDVPAGSTRDALRWPLHLHRAEARANLRELAAARADLDIVLAGAGAVDAAATAAALTILGEVQVYEGEVAAALDTYDGAIARWRALGDALGLAGALRGRGMADLFGGHLDRAEATIREALDTYRASADQRGEAWALQNLAWIAFQSGRHEESEERVLASADVFQAIGDWGGLGWAMGLLAWIRFYQGDLDGSLELARVVEDEAREVANPWALAMMRVLLANLALWRGAPIEAVDRASDARALFHSLGDRWGELQSLAPVTRSLAMLGRFAEADERIAEMRTIAPALADRGLHVIPAALTATLALVRADPPAALRALEEHRESEPRNLMGVERFVLAATAFLLDGRPEQAIDALEPITLATDPPPTVGAHAASGCILALAYATAGRADDALATATGVLALPGGTFLDRMYARLALGAAQVQLGEHDAARSTFTELVEVLDGTESLVDQAIGSLARARALERTGDGADGQLASARDRLRELGIDPAGWDRILDRALTGAPTRDPAPS